MIHNGPVHINVHLSLIVHTIGVDPHGSVIHIISAMAANDNREATINHHSCGLNPVICFCYEPNRGFLSPGHASLDSPCSVVGASLHDVPNFATTRIPPNGPTELILSDTPISAVTMPGDHIRNFWFLREANRYIQFEGFPIAAADPSEQVRWIGT